MITDAKHGFSAPSSGKKMNPLEKAEVSGIASGATMEGLDLALGTEEEWPPTEYVEDLADGEVEVKMDGLGRHFRIQKLTKVQQDSCAGCNDGDAIYLIQCRYHDLHPNDFADLIYCTDCLTDNVVETDAFMCGDCEDEFGSEEEPPEKDDPLESWMEDYDAEEPSAYDFVKEEMLKASPITESEVNLFLDKLSNVPMSYLKQARSEAIKSQDEMAVGIITMAINRRSFREEWASEEEDDYVEMMVCAFCEEFGEGQIPTGVDIDSGDRWSPPTADITGWEICEYCEGKGEVEDTPENQKIPNWDWDYLLPDEPDYDRYDDRYDDWDAESNEDAILRQQAIDTIEARVADYTTHEDVSPYWGGGIVNPNQYLYFKLRYAWNNHPEQKEEIIQQYMRGIKDGRIDPSNPLPHGSPNQHLTSRHSAEETNGDKQLELAVKRTQMSALRTGLAITTFGIVLWNLWTNKKQEKQISDIMGLV